jgi:hypothetical protein
MQNKLISATELMNLQQRQGETPLAFKLRVMKNLDRVKTLKVTVEELSAIKFLTGLAPKYQPIVNTISVRGGAIVVEDVYKSVVEFDQRESINVENDIARANMVVAGGENTVTFTERELAFLVSSAKNSASQAFSSLPRYEHDPDNHIDSPTEKESKFSCYRCGVHGHAARTCRSTKRLNDNGKNDKYSDKGRKKGKRETAKYANSHDAVAYSAREIFVENGLVSSSSGGEELQTSTSSDDL